jgi:hypothetical protein
MCHASKSVGLTGDAPNIAKIPRDEELEQLLSPYINTLTKRLQDILVERMSTRYTGNHLSGKLLSKNAHKILADEKRVFSKKNTPNKPHYVVTMALDESGSMRGERHMNTYIAAYLLNRTCEKLGFPVNLIMFDDDARVIPKLRDYQSKYSGGGNDEAEVIRVLKKITHKEDDNLVFILTDGGCGYEVRPDVEKFTKDGYIMCAVAVGLSEKNNRDDVEQLRSNYPDVVLAENVENLPAIMIAQMRKFIHR